MNQEQTGSLLLRYIRAEFDGFPGVTTSAANRMANAEELPNVKYYLKLFKTNVLRLMRGRYDWIYILFILLSCQIFFLC